MDYKLERAWRLANHRELRVEMTIKTQDSLAHLSEIKERVAQVALSSIDALEDRTAIDVSIVEKRVEPNMAAEYSPISFERSELVISKSGEPTFVEPPAEEDVDEA